MDVDHASATDIGRVRPSMQDVAASLAPAPGWTLLVVADGMGGAPAGDVASALAVEAAVAGLRAGLAGGSAGASQEVAGEAALREAVAGANAAVWEASRAEPARRGMGTTLTLALLGEGQALLAHVGDSRAYLWRAGSIRRLTADHSYVGERVRAGTLAAAEAALHPLRNVITRVVGTEPAVEPDVFAVGVEAGDVVVVCTDGAHGVVGDEALAAAIGGAVDGGAAAVCASIVAAALDGGGPDNVGVAVGIVRG